jgi:hypothetical protein
LTNNSIANVTAYNAAIATGSMVLISSQTASASASISFTTGIDSTYKEYQFYFINCHPATDGATFDFNMSTDAGSNYNVTKTTTFFEAQHAENGTDANVVYVTSRDLAQSTSFQQVNLPIDNDNDSSLSGSLTLFNPSSTTYVKHFIANSNIVHNAATQYTINAFVAGYGNTTSAINAVQFKMSSGNFDDGTILMFGIK